MPSKEYYNNSKWVKEYGRTIGEVLEALYREATPHITNSGLNIWSETLVRSLIDFETRLAEATSSRQYAHDPSKYYNIATIDEVEALIPQLSPRKLIERQFPGYSLDKIIVESREYLRTIQNVLQDSNRETIQAYFVWKTVQAYGPHVIDDALEPLRKLNNRLQGREASIVEERWKTCVSHVDYGLSRFTYFFCHR